MDLRFNDLKQSTRLLIQHCAHSLVGLAIVFASTEVFAEAHAEAHTEAHIVTFQRGQLLCAERFALSSQPKGKRGRFAVVSAQLLPLQSNFSDAERAIINDLTNLESANLENCDSVAQLVADSGINFGYLYGRVSISETKDDHRVGNCTIIKQTVEMQILQPGSVNLETAEVRMTLSATDVKMDCEGI